MIMPPHPPSTAAPPPPLSGVIRGAGQIELGRTIKAILHESVFRLHPTYVSFIGIVARRAKQSEVAWISTTIFALDAAQGIEKSTADPAVYSLISERYRLIFEVFSGARLIRHEMVGYMGTSRLALKNATPDDQHAVEAAVSLLDNTIVTTLDGLDQQRLLSALDITVLRPNRLLLAVKAAAPEVYNSAVAEHRKASELSPTDHMSLMKRWGV